MLKVVREERRFKNIFSKSMFSPVTFEIWNIGHILERRREKKRDDEKKKSSILFNRLGWMADSLKGLINQHMNIYTKRHETSH